MSPIFIIVTLTSRLRVRLRGIYRRIDVAWAVHQGMAEDAPKEGALPPVAEHAAAGGAEEAAPAVSAGGADAPDAGENMHLCEREMRQRGGE